MGGKAIKPLFSFRSSLHPIVTIFWCFIVMYNCDFYCNIFMFSCKMYAKALIIHCNKMNHQLKIKNITTFNSTDFQSFKKKKNFSLQFKNNFQTTDSLNDFCKTKPRLKQNYTRCFSSDKNWKCSKKFAYSLYT